jgi:hypothetical protein
MRFLGPVTGYALRNYMSMCNETTEEHFGVANVVEESITEEYRRYWGTNMGRMIENRLPKRAVQYRSRRRIAGRPKRRWYQQ